MFIACNNRHVNSERVHNIRFGLSKTRRRKHSFTHRFAEEIAKQWKAPTSQKRALSCLYHLYTDSLVVYSTGPFLALQSAIESRGPFSWWKSSAPSIFAGFCQSALKSSVRTTLRLAALWNVLTSKWERVRENRSRDFSPIR